MPCFELWLVLVLLCVKEVDWTDVTWQAWSQCSAGTGNMKRYFWIPSRALYFELRDGDGLIEVWASVAAGA